jgi:hypothetical protein
MTNYRRTFVDGVFMKNEKYSMGERKALSPILRNYETRLINILLLMPSVLIFLFYVSQKYWLSLVWNNFFEHKESLRHYSNIMFWFGAMILCFVGTFLFQSGHLICFIFKKDWHSFSKCAIGWSLILFLPLAGIFIAGWYKESSNIIILKSLK